MSAASVTLTKPTNRTVDGPKFQSENHQVIVEYDHEYDDGSVDWAQIVFDEALVFEYREATCCKEEDMIGATEVRCLTESDLLTQVLNRWKQPVGWQEWQQEQGGAERFKHFTVFFDDAGCVEAVAASCRAV